DFHGTVSEFLASKQAASLREFEQEKLKEVAIKNGSADSKKNSFTENKGINREQQKELRKIKNDLNKVELEIQKVEQHLKDLNKKLFSPDLSTEKATEIGLTIKENEKKLSAFMQQWEEISLTIESYEI